MTDLREAAQAAALTKLLETLREKCAEEAMNRAFDMLMQTALVDEGVAKYSDAIGNAVRQIELDVAVRQFLAALPLALKEEAGADSFHLTSAGQSEGLTGDALDARRYRWLRDTNSLKEHSMRASRHLEPLQVERIYFGHPEKDWYMDCFATAFGGAKFDAAVDAAIAAQVEAQPEARGRMIPESSSADVRASPLSAEAPTMKHAEELGKAADTVDNLCAAMSMPMAPQLHLIALKQSLPALRDVLRLIYVNETGENPWSTLPESLGRVLQGGAE